MSLLKEQDTLEEAMELYRSIELVQRVKYRLKEIVRLPDRMEEIRRRMSHVGREIDSPAAHIYMMTDVANIDKGIIFDSGAEYHVTGNFALLSRVTAVKKGRGVVSASEHFMPAICSGSLIIDGIKLSDVLFVPGVTGTIVSVSRLDDLGYSVEVVHGKCLVTDAITGDLVGKGHRVRGLYMVEHLEIPLDRAPVA